MAVDWNVSHEQYVHVSSSKASLPLAGLAPQCNEGDGKRKSNRFSKAGACIKPLLIFGYQKRRGHKKAIAAIARMLLTANFHILKKIEPYNPEL